MNRKNALHLLVNKNCISSLIQQKEYDFLLWIARLILHTWIFLYLHLQFISTTEGEGEINKTAIVIDKFTANNIICKAQKTQKYIRPSNIF